MLKKFLLTYFPNNYLRWIFLILCFSILIYCIYLPLSKNFGQFELFYHAAKVALYENQNPYINLDPKFNLFKYGLSFLLIFLAPLTFLEIHLAAVIWQAMNALCVICGTVYLLTRSEWIKPNKFSVAAAILISFVLIKDLEANATYLQSNGILTGLILWSIAFYGQGKWIYSAVFLALGVNFKILPLVLFLLLSVDLNARFILSFFISLAFFYLAPMMFFGFETTLAWYGSLLNVLMKDTNIAFSPEQLHHYFGLQPFIQALTGVPWEKGYRLFSLFFAFVTFLAIAVNRFNFKQVYPSINPIVHMLLGIYYMMIFSPRTEGPNLILLIPCYVVFLVMAESAKGRWRFFLLAATALLFFITSLSTSDIGKVVGVQGFFWEYNLRFVGLALGYFLALFICFTRPSALNEFLFGDAPQRISKS